MKLPEMPTRRRSIDRIPAALLLSAEGQRMVLVSRVMVAGLGFKDRNSELVQPQNAGADCV